MVGVCGEDFIVDFAHASAVRAVVFFTALPKYYFRIEGCCAGGSRWSCVLKSKRNSEAKKVMFAIGIIEDYRGGKTIVII